MKPLIIGTAGHVDHGKSTLIRALTGIDPDRLREEKERGMTIDLGFAWIDLPRSGRIGIVDVPGHERFLKNMLAGAGGVDLALLVVAADEGVKPQTREHLDILGLLEVRGIVVALTKCDLAEEEIRALVAEEVVDLLEKRNLPEPTIVETSATTGQGLPELREALDFALERLPSRDSTTPARMPIDRVFTMSGFGTVVTGTLVAGSLCEGHSYLLLPGAMQCRVRSLQVHGEKVSEAVAGQRVAANLAGVQKERIQRGQVLCESGACEETVLFDALVTVLPDAPPLRHNARIRLHLGSAEAIARVTLNPSGEIPPAGTGAAQIRCEAPIVCARGDRFVLRRYSPGITVGGGQVVLPSAPRRKRAQIRPETFETALRATPEEAVFSALSSSVAGLDVVSASRVSGLRAEQVQAALEGLVATGRVLALGERFITVQGWAGLKEALLRPVRAYHEAHPTNPWMPRATWASATPLLDDPKAFDAATARLVQEGLLESVGSGVRATGFQVQLSEKQRALLDRVVQALRSAGLRVPTVAELPRFLGLPEPAIREALRLGRSVERIVKVSEDLYYPTETIEEIKRLVREEISRVGSLTVAAFRDLTQTSRKYAVPLLEYLDAVRFTRRVGDDRVLAEGAD